VLKKFAAYVKVLHMHTNDEPEEIAKNFSMAELKVRNEL
jgi:hypothetical protein